MSIVLSEIIEQSYSLFAMYHPSRPLDICTDCCMTPEEEGKLAGLPVREIPRDLLSYYNDGAKPEKTRIEEIKHFLPRYLDLIGNFQFPTHSTELSFSRLIPFEKNEWSKEELDVLLRFNSSFFKHCLTLYPIPSFSDEIDTILIMFWRAGFNIAELLTIWEDDKTLVGTLHFRDLYFHSFEEYNPTKLSSGFADKGLADILLTWRASDKVKQNFAGNIEQIIIEKNDLDIADLNELNLLYDILRAK